MLPTPVMLLPLLLMSACRDADPPARDRPAAAAATGAAGETQLSARAPGGETVHLRSGRTVPVTLPDGLTLFPGARIIAGTQAVRARKRAGLLEFETRAAMPEVALFYRKQARAAGLVPTLDIVGRDGASLGGPLPKGGAWSIAMTRRSGVTRVVIAQD